MLLVMSGFGCAPNPRPASPDGRGCYVAILTDEQSAWLFLHYSIQAKTGDVLLSRACVDDDIEGVVNEVRRLTR